MKIIIFLTEVLIIDVMGINYEYEVNTIKQEMQKHAKECFKEMNVTQEEEQRLKIDTKFGELRMRCFSVCLMKKSEEIGEDMKPNLERISQIEHALHPRKATEIMELILQCLDEVKNVEDECDFANEYDDCVEKKTWKILQQERIP
ncbi:uncharacterized protein LOC117168512 [Belonocnema kinseyi]|uniref:uncharacterized protein LOC117168512 n=1 Tax=Belonocnema kinseyi TaxID=2817044 RepID=UPI00143DF149|nr:uncharacterized protein LOC117168512 [Belonocnema kinseyi]